jgi:SAM-dependent methyltransferase
VTNRSATPSNPLHPPASAVQATNAERWSADDDAWRGYRREGGRIVLDARIESTLALLLPAPGGALLDVGCATGVVTEWMADKVGAARVVGVDFVPAPASASKLETQAVNLDSTEPLPYADATFDVVTCLETVEHVHDTDHLVSELRRVLKPTGYAVVSVPRIDGLLTVTMLALGMQPPAIECSLRRRYGSPEAGTRVSGHVSHFTRRALEELLASHRFRIDAFAQASIYRSWLLAAPRRPSLWKRLPLWAFAQVPFKKDVQIVRVRPVLAS